MTQVVPPWRKQHIFFTHVPDEINEMNKNYYRNIDLTGNKMGMEQKHEKTIVTWNNDICLGKQWTTISGEVDLQLSITGPEWLFNGGHLLSSTGHLSLWIRTFSHVRDFDPQDMACPKMLATRNPLYHHNPYFFIGHQIGLSPVSVKAQTQRHGFPTFPAKLLDK